MSLHLIARCDACKRTAQLDLLAYNPTGAVPVPDGWHSPGFFAYICDRCANPDLLAADIIQAAETIARDAAEKDNA